MQRVNEAFLSLGLEDFSEISDNQLKLLDISPEHRSDWFELALEKQISDARAELFVLLKGIKAKTNQDKIIDNYKNLQRFRKGEEAVSERVGADSASSSQQGEVVIYCDGGCSPNPGASGSGISIYRAGKLSELWYGLYEPMGTNNTAELKALYHALRIAEEEAASGNSVEIKCDSLYSINCITTWAYGWKRNGWKKKGGEIKNLDLIQPMFSLHERIKDSITLSHIKAHNGMEGNELADRMTHYSRQTKQSEFVKYDQAINITEILKMG